MNASPYLNASITLCLLDLLIDNCFFVVFVFVLIFVHIYSRIKPDNRKKGVKGQCVRFSCSIYRI